MHFSLDQLFFPFWCLTNLLFARLSQARVVATINQMILSNPTIVQFTKDTEWLSSLLAYIPRFEDATVLGPCAFRQLSMKET